MCKHHAMILANGCGNKQLIECPYHGWQYDLTGRLRKSVKMKGIAEFSASKVTLTPINCITIGPFIYISFDLKYKQKQRKLGAKLSKEEEEKEKEEREKVKHYY